MRSLKWHDGGTEVVHQYCTFIVGAGLATYDYADLTKLVVHCHDECLRAEIGNGGPNGLKIALSNRERKSKRPDSGAHPTLEQHVEQIRRGWSYQSLFEQLRAQEETP